MLLVQIGVGGVLTTALLVALDRASRRMFAQRHRSLLSPADSHWLDSDSAVFWQLQGALLPAVLSVLWGALLCLYR